MVTQHLDKRLALARAHHTSANLEAIAEIRVCMGFDQVTGRTLFVLANGAIVPRRPTSQLPSTYVSFNCIPKSFTITSNTPIPSASQSPSQPIPSSVIQFPNTSHTTAIDSIIDQIPDPHAPPPPDLLLHPTQQNTFSHAPTICHSNTIIHQRSNLNDLRPLAATNYYSRPRHLNFNFVQSLAHPSFSPDHP